jgi:hypothetical protein
VNIKIDWLTIWWYCFGVGLKEGLTGLSAEGLN